MKKEIIRFVDSIEGFGNLVVTKPDGSIQKHGFKNTITEHFRKNLINAILYGDEEKVFDDSGNETPNSNPHGYYWSNKLIGYQFKVTVGVGGGVSSNYPTEEEKNLVRDGLNKNIDFSTIPTSKLGESRYNVIGTVDTNQAQLVDGFTPQELRLGKDINPATGEWTSFNQQKAFDFSQNVFVGYTEVLVDPNNPDSDTIPGLKQPKFKPARENVKLYINAADSNKTETSIVNIDKWSNMAKSWFDWDVMSKKDGGELSLLDPAGSSYNGVKATLRQSMGAATWVVHAHKTNNEKLIAKYGLQDGYDENEVLWGSNGDINSRGKQTTGSNGTILKMDDPSKLVQYVENSRLRRATITEDFYQDPNQFDGEDSLDFFPVAFELFQPDERWYWSFNNSVENTSRYDLAQETDTTKWMARDVETEKLGEIIAIEVMNFPSKIMYGTSNSELAVDPETIAYHCPASNKPIKIDRNDNLTVEYNFKFTTPQSGTVTWNGMYLDELARAINPIKDTEQTTNSANKIQMTGAVLYEKGIFENTTEVHTIDGHINTYERKVPNTIEKKDTQWRHTINELGASSDTAPVSSNPNFTGGNIINIPDGNTTVEGSTVHRLSSDGGTTYDSAGTLTPEFARIWISPYSDLFTDKTAGSDFLNGDFTNDQRVANIPYNYNWIPTTGHDTWKDRRSFYAQTHHTRKVLADDTFGSDNVFDYFQHMVSLFFDNIQKLDFHKNRCQIFLSPYGNISKAILRHAKLTNWLNSRNVGIWLDNNNNQTGVSQTGTGGDVVTNTPLYNIETIWQNGLRLFTAQRLAQLDFNDSSIDAAVLAAFYLTLHNAADDAANTLKFYSEGSKDSFMIPSKDEGKSVIHLKATSDSRFVEPPAFFTVNYGSQFGHPVPGDMHDEKIESKWILKDNWMDQLNKISAAAGFYDGSVNWTNYYRVEDRDMIEQLDSHAKEHYLAINDLSGFGDQGFLVKYWENSKEYPVWPELQISDEKQTGLAIIHDSNLTTIQLSSPANDSILTEPPNATPDAAGNVPSVDSTGADVWEAGDDYVIAHTTYTKPDNKRVKQKLDKFIADLNGKTLPKVMGPDNISVVFRGDENRIIYNGKLYSRENNELLWDFRLNPVNVFGYIDENQFSIAEPEEVWTYVEDGDGQIYPPSQNPTEVTAELQYDFGEGVVNVLGHNGNDAAGNSPSTAWALGDIFKMAAGTPLEGETGNDMVGNSPPHKRWNVDDNYWFAGQTAATVLTADGTAPELHSSVLGRTDSDYTRIVIKIVNTTTDTTASPPEYTVDDAINAFVDDIEGNSFEFDAGQANTYTVTEGKLPTSDENWGPGDKFVLETWNLDYYDQFLGQRFTQRTDTTSVAGPEFTTTWDIEPNFYTDVAKSALTDTEKETAVLGDGDKIDVSITDDNDHFISDKIKTLIEDDGVLLDIDIVKVSADTSNPLNAYKYTKEEAEVAYGGISGDWKTGNETTKKSNQTRINDVVNNSYIRNLTASDTDILTPSNATPDAGGNVPSEESTGADVWEVGDPYQFDNVPIKVLTHEDAGMLLYPAYIANPTAANYKTLLVRMKQIMDIRDIYTVRVADYIQRKIEFDPQIYEVKKVTETGIQYSYTTQGSIVREISGVYDATDTDINTNYSTALQSGYRETAPFRVKWPALVDSGDATPDLATTNPVLNIDPTKSYGRFTDAGGTATHTFGDYDTEWSTIGIFDSAKMKELFPIYECWAQRMKQTVALNAEASEKSIYDFPIPKSFRLDGESVQPFVNYNTTTNSNVYNDGSTTLSSTETKMDSIDEHDAIPFPSIDDMVDLVKLKEDSAGFFQSDDELKQFVTSIAPFGFKEFYEYDNATPSHMRLSLPHPNYHMFYGDIVIGGGNTGGSGAVDGPTWTPGDKVIMDWIVKPPASDSSGVSGQTDDGGI